MDKTERTDTAMPRRQSAPLADGSNLHGEGEKADHERAYSVRRILLRYYRPDGFAGSGESKLALRRDLMRARDRWASLYWTAVGAMAMGLAVDVFLVGQAWESAGKPLRLILLILSAIGGVVAGAVLLLLARQWHRCQILAAVIDACSEDQLQTFVNLVTEDTAQL